MYKLDNGGIADYNDVFQNRQEKSCLSKAESEYADSDSDNEDAASENSEYAESEAQEIKENNESEISIYDVSQQIKNLTKQVSYLTKIVYNVFTDKNNPNAFRGHGLAGFH